jgi:tetratricopeptide (TPR) repeat protein
LPKRAEPPAFEAVRELLHHAREPRWLRANGFVAQYWGERIDLGADDYRLLQSVRSAILAALDGLPSRVRIVAERTALDGESCRRTARALGISERQAHRDRARAIQAIAERLSSAPHEAPQPPVVASRVLDVHLGQAAILGELGLFDRAEALLREVAQGAESRAVEARALTRLARLATERGQLSAAQEYAESAARAAHAADCRVARADAASARARLDVMKGRLELGERQLRESVHALRPLVASGGASAREALIEAHIGQSEAFRTAGLPHEAQAAARQADALARELERPPLPLKLAVGAALVDCGIFLWSDPAAVEAETNGYYAQAIAAGSTRGALHFALFLSAVAHFKGRYAESAAILRQLVPVAADFGRCTTKSYFLLELGIALTFAGHTAEALDVLDTAAEEAPAEYAQLCGYVNLSRSTSQLKAGDALAALGSAEAASTLLSGSYDPSLQGGCMLKKAQALLALGRFPEALAAAEISREMTGTYGQPVIVQDTQRMIARLRARLSA